jgi:hypothetical protein
VAATGALLSKSTTGAAYVIFLVVPLVLIFSKKIISLPELYIRSATFAVLVLAPALSAAILWVRFSDALKSQSVIGQKLTSSSLRDWNFGSFEQRLNFDTWDTMFERILSAIWGPVGTIAVVIVIFYLAWQRLQRDYIIVVVGSVAVAILVFLVFTNLYFVHTYYLLALYPMLVTAFGLSARVVMSNISPSVTLKRVIVSTAVFSQLVFHISAPASVQLFQGYSSPNSTPYLSSVISKNTQELDLILMVNCDWDPTTLYFADRKGYMVPSWAVDSVPEEVKSTLKSNSDNYELLVFCAGVEFPQDFVPENIELSIIPSEHGQVFRLRNSLG